MLNKMCPLQEKKCIFVTGATGFIGKALIRELLVHGHKVRAGLRRRCEAMPLDVEIYQHGDLMARTDWYAALSDADTVIHLAGNARETSAKWSLSAYWPINVAATVELAQQAAQAGVRRLIFLSTAKVMGEISPGRPWIDNDPPSPQSGYAQSKYAAEQGLLKVAEKTGLEVVILRPPLVYGPGVGGNFLTLLHAVAKGWPVPIGASQARRSLCYIGNLVAAITSCITRPNVAGRHFLVADVETMPLKELVKFMANMMGRRICLPAVSPGLLNFIARVTGYDESVRRMFASFEVDASAFWQSSGVSPPVSLTAGMHETLRWYQECYG